jgi:MtN3 and saliva related transmembrane protein
VARIITDTKDIQSFMLNLESIVGIVAGICTGASLLPQLVKMFKEQKATDISLPMLIILLSGLGLWIWYGVMKKDWPIILTNSFSLLVNVLIIILRWHFKRQGRQ